MSPQNSLVYQSCHLVLESCCCCNYRFPDVRSINYSDWNVFRYHCRNIGPHSGACILLETLFGHPLLWLACRHHMMEVLLSDIFSMCLGPSSGPDITIFKRFRKIWSRLNHHTWIPVAQIINASDEIKYFIIECMEAQFAS